MNNLSNIIAKDVSEKEKLKRMYDWSKGFQKFVCCPLSACFLQKRTLKETNEFGNKVNSGILAKVFVLYPHTIRKEILWRFSDIMQLAVLEKMYQYVRSDAFSLTECVDAEKVMQDTLEELWPDRFQEYKEMKEMEELIAHGIGKKEYLFSQDVCIRKNKQGIYFVIDVNLQEYHIHYDEPSWHSYCYGRSLEAYLLFFHGYIQKQEGTVYLEVKYTHKVPHMDELFIGKDKKHLKNQEWVDEQEYFLLIYRIRNLVRMFSWIKLSDKLDVQVQELEQLLKKKNFYSKVTGNHLLCENIFLERIKAKFSDNIVKKNFSFWLFREDGKYRKTCIELIDVADLWWIKDNNLTLLFWGMQSFEKSILKMLLFMGLGIDLFLERNLKMIEADRLKLGYEMEECDGVKVSNIQCVLYDMASIDTKHEELFAVLNDNHYKDRIHFHYLDGMVLNDEKLLELQEESFSS